MVAWGVATTKTKTKTKTKIQMPLSVWTRLVAERQKGGYIDFIPKALEEDRKSFEEMIKRNEALLAKKPKELTKEEVEGARNDLLYLRMVIEGHLIEFYRFFLLHGSNYVWFLAGLKGAKGRKAIEKYEAWVGWLREYLFDVFLPANSETLMHLFTPATVKTIPYIVSSAKKLLSVIETTKSALSQLLEYTTKLLEESGVNPDKLSDKKLPRGFQEPPAFSLAIAMSDPEKRQHAAKVVRSALRKVEDELSDTIVEGEVSPALLLVSILPDYDLTASGISRRGERDIIIVNPTPQTLETEKDGVLADSDAYLTHAVAHEVGHGIWAALPAKDRARWTRANKNYLVARNKQKLPHHTSYYAQRGLNSEEGFCEVFGSLFWANPPEYLAGLQEKLRGILSGT